MDWNERLDTLVAGYQDSAILLAAVRHRLFDALDETPRAPDAVAADRGVDPRACGMVLHALAGAGVLEVHDGGFTLPADRARLLRSDGDDTQVSIYSHHMNLLPRWAELDAVLATGRHVPRPEYDGQSLEDFICGMENISRRSSVAVAEAIDLSGARRLLDLGGGPGTAALTFAAANPQLECVVFDLEGPVAIAERQIAAAGLQDRVTVHAGDYFKDDMGEGFDVVYISNIVHSMDADQTAGLLAKCREALLPGGRVMVKDFYLDETGCSPRFASRFAVNMLVCTEGGKSYGDAEMRTLLAEAGFGDVERVEIPKHSAVLIGTRGD